jgi:hypothetical protein
MSRKQTPKKIVPKIQGMIEERIVELSLQNPDFGAQRLSPLLKNKNISVSSSQIYTILKRHNMQTRAKRLAKLADRSPKKPAPAAKKKPARITDEVAEQIVQVSLQNPDYGAQRLVPLLEKEGILLTASAVYRMLKRNGLQNRDKRLARSQGQQAVEELPAETIEPPPPDPFQISPPATEPESIPEASEPIVPAPAEKPEPIPDVIEEKVPSSPAEPQPLPGIIEKQISPPAAEPEQFRPGIVETRGSLKKLHHLTLRRRQKPLKKLKVEAPGF